MASEEEVRKQDEALEALKRDLEAARYAAQRESKIGRRCLLVL